MSNAPGTDTDLCSALNTVTCEMQGLALLQQALTGLLGERFAEAVSALAASPGRVIVTGVGKSGHIARKIAATFAATGRPAHFLHPAEASHGDLGIVTPHDIVLALSWSGESAELSDIVAYARRFSIPLLASTSVAESTLARAADIALVLPSADEACAESLAPTTSTTMQLALGDALAVALLRRSGPAARSMQHLHPGGRLGARLKLVRDLMHGPDEVPLVPETATLAEAIVRMTRGRFGMTGIADAAGRLTGVITDGDLRRAFALGGIDLHARGVRDVMGTQPQTVAPDEPAHAALARMNAASITGLFVVEHGLPIGVLHIHDLLRAGLA